MLTIAARDVLEGRVDIGDEPYCIYVVRERETVFYVGRSWDPQQRLREHFGLSWRSSGGTISSLYEQYPEEALGWQIDLYTLEECEPQVVVYLHRRLEVYQNPAHYEKSMRDAEVAMILHLRPCLNVSNNPSPSRLPDQYLYLPRIG